MSKRLMMMLMAVVLVSGLFSNLAGAAPDGQDEQAAAGGTYEIYPIPQQQSSQGADFTLTSQVNVVFESGIDTATRNKLRKVLETKSLQVTETSAVSATRSNVVIGIKGSKGYADTYFTNRIPYSSTLFNEKDAYVLDLNASREAKGTIAVLGKDTDAAFYALETLGLILEQTANQTLHSVKYEDYADTKWRGFIEGFYGFPWSNEDRKSLMRFGGRFKMNTYIFAPKNDQYHNSAWRTLYPADELAKIKELVDVGNETKNHFVWAIHPGFNMINWNNYDAELQTLLAKLNQLYGAGVRQFGLFMDDISTSQSLTDKDKHVKLITDVANWAAAKGDVKPLIYCPPFYNQGWTGEGGKPYLQALANVPANVDIMWTGKGVVAPVNTTDMQWVKNLTGRDPFMWLNWPVNDYKDSRLMLGKGEVLVPGTHNISGVVSNPMGWAELSKVALFAVADYTWNVDDFQQDSSWLNSFKYVAPEAASELNTISYHLSDPSPSGHGLQVGESENIRADLEDFLSKYASGQPLQASGTKLINDFDQILGAIQSFRAKSQNPKMLQEIDPWLKSLKGVASSGQAAVRSAMALNGGNTAAAWEELSKASSALADSRAYTIKKLSSPDVTVEAGAKRLVPFAQQLINKLDAQIYTSMDPDYVIPVPVTSYGSPSDIGRMIDGDPATYMYVQTVQKNGDWYGLDLGKTVKIRDVSILQGRNDTDHDIFQRGVLETSVNGTDWTAIGEERSGFSITAAGLNTDARYIRYRLTHAGVPGGKPDLWTAVREFTVNATSGKAGIYTNVAGLQNRTVSATDTSAELTGLNQITLKPGEYVGIRLKAIEQIEEIAVAHTGSGIAVESSPNGIEWDAVPAGGPYGNAAYIRLINDGTADATFDISRLLVKLAKFVPASVSHNYASVYSGAAGNLYDGKLDTKTWFGDGQAKGKYVQVDLGGVVDVQNVAVVIGDGEGDYFRKGDLQLSRDGQSWETIHTFNNPGDRTLNFPDHEVPYRYKRVALTNSKPARYVRLMTTESNNAWLALNEIIVNEGMEKPGSSSPAIGSQPSGKSGFEAGMAIDRKLSTFFTPASEGAGSLSYRLASGSKLEKLIVLQGPSNISNAEVKVRDENGWHSAGTLSQSYNAVNMTSFGRILEAKLQWNGGVLPRFHEIIPVLSGTGGEEAAGENATSLTGPAALKAGQSFSADLGVKNVKGSMYAADLKLTYDPALVEFESAASTKDGFDILESRHDTPGEVRMIAASSGTDHAVTGNMQLLSFAFKAKDVQQNTEGSIKLIRSVLGDAEGKELEALPSTYAFEVTAGSPEPGVPGDVNKDGKVSIGDLAIVAASYGKNEQSPDWQQVLKADVNGDGMIDLLDLAFIARKIVG
ncbi:beta-N-acetylglucosaminidase domain-containing protein [Paenibacillus sp. SAF-054]|uniref:beta-N-acetylglucosaminidase domain-containing protein n=1 Tax=unclassified Paenibacillus TaxID=185978 RepID=UPI003F7D8822